jgi:hypothetical protein
MAKNEDELKDVKEKLAKDARAVGRAADRVLRVPMNTDGFIGREWGQTMKDVDDLDVEFEDESNNNESLMSKLRQKYAQGDVEVRVMKQGPNGRLIDVSDQVNLNEIRPEHIEGVQVDGGRTSRVPQDRAAALKLLQEIIPGLRLSSARPTSTTSTSIALMEAALAESDKILEHWKK